MATWWAPREADLAFHLLVSEMSGNQPMQQAALQFRPHLAYSLRLPFADHTRIGETAAEHQRITWRSPAATPGGACRDARPPAPLGRPRGPARGRPMILTHALTLDGDSDATSFLHPADRNHRGLFRHACPPPPAPTCWPTCRKPAC